VTTAQVETVAVLALAYAGLAKGSTTGARVGFDNLIDDLDNDPGSVSLLTMIASDSLTDVDWEIVSLAFEDPAALRTLILNFAESDPLRAEALAHAWPDELTPSPVAMRYLARWEQVEEFMEFLREEGVETTRDDVALVADVATGRFDDLVAGRFDGD
jgi:hypothetical protein